MGIYDKVLATLPKRPPEDATRQANLNAVKEQILNPANEDDFEPKILEDALAQVTGAVGVLCELFLTSKTQRYASVLGRRYSILRDAEERIERELKELGLVLDALEQLAIDQYEAEGVSTVKFDDGQRSYRSQGEPYVTLKDNEALRGWIKKHSLDAILTVHPSKLASMTKQLLVVGEPPPDGVEVYAHKKLVKNPLPKED